MAQKSIAFILLLCAIVFIFRRISGYFKPIRAQATKRNVNRGCGGGCGC